jgi:hypothetical protein
LQDKIYEQDHWEHIKENVLKTLKNGAKKELGIKLEEKGKKDSQTAKIRGLFDQ